MAFNFFKKIFSYDLEKVRLELYRDYLNSGMDRVQAYQMAYNVSYEEALEIIKKENYDFLINSGLSDKDARKMAYREVDEDEKTL